MHLLTNRRACLAAGLAAAAATIDGPRGAVAQNAAPGGPFSLPPLPYPATANEAAIDARTMELHHGAHHQAYVTALNAAVGPSPTLATLPLARLLRDLDKVPEAARTAVRNNAGGHANHTMFWEIMGGRGGEPRGEVAAAIGRDLGGWAAFRETFERTGMAQFGSGWVFVAIGPQGRLSIVGKPDQDTPWMDGQAVLIGNDVWEHAYYLRYQNRRAEYLKAWWNVLDWERIEARYVAARAGTLPI